MKKTIAIVSLLLNILTVIGVAIVVIKVSDIHASIFSKGDFVEEFTIDPNITTAKTADEVFGTNTNTSEDIFAEEW